MECETRVCRLYGARNVKVETETRPPPAEGEVLVSMGHGGICGSDLHYYRDGGMGQIRVREPIILGHEIAGRIAETGPGVAGLRPGDLVAIDPSRPCRECAYCEGGAFQHCLNMKFMGSAQRFPHVQGGFRESLCVESGQCARFSKVSDARLAACAEPLAVCLHACGQAGNLSGKMVLVTGSGPIGLICTALAAAYGAAEVVATDIEDAPLSIARTMGAGRAINARDSASDLDQYREGKGRFDVVFECSAASSAIRSAIEVVRPQGTVVQVGIRGDAPLPIRALVAKEIALIGSFRFRDEFREAARMIDAGEIDLLPIITHDFPIEQVEDALRMAGDRASASKVQIRFAERAS